MVSKYSPREDPEDPLAPPEEVLTMLSKTRSTPANSPEPGVIPDRTPGPVSNGSAVSNRDAPARHATPARGGPASARDSAASELDERRHQRAIAREGNGGKRGASTDEGRKRGAETRERLYRAKAQLAEPSRRGRLALGESVSLGLIGIVIVGFLVAALTLMLSAVLRRAPASADAQTSGSRPEFSRSTRRWGSPPSSLVFIF